MFAFCDDGIETVWPQCSKKCLFETHWNVEEFSFVRFRFFVVFEEGTENRVEHARVVQEVNKIVLDADPDRSTPKNEMLIHV